MPSVQRLFRPCLAVIGLLLTASCATVPVAIWNAPPFSLAGASEATLNAITICTDSLGRYRSATAGSRCTPCIPYAVRADADRALTHARLLWRQIARAPYDSLVDVGATCTRFAFELAAARRADDHGLAAEITAFTIASIHPNVRRLALQRFDRRLDSLVNAGRLTAAQEMLGAFALAMWDRSQRLLERADIVTVVAYERRAHDLRADGFTFRQLPAIPTTSPVLGVSEAEWSAHLFTRAAFMSDAATSVRWRRLSLAPWVVLGQWRSLDSAALAMLRVAPNDSIALPARALAAFQLMQRPVLESPATMRLFDSALVHLPRADSARHDSFDNILTATDDDWRFGFLPTDRRDVEIRGWLLLDPMWSTPVNEIRLERRARVAEADLRYADITRPGQSGGETEPGLLLIRRGAPDARWIASVRNNNDNFLSRGWFGLLARATVDHDTAFWRVFHGDRLSPAQLAGWSAATVLGACSPQTERTTVAQCARASRADWTKVPFVSDLDTVDVVVARFRATADSIAFYIGARIPLRRFRQSDDEERLHPDSITAGVWLSTAKGVALFQRSETRLVPRTNEMAWSTQWTARTAPGEVLHRVEAMEPSRPTGARGAAILTSDTQALFRPTGFGMSDVLVAASATDQRAPARRWTDYTVQPNGGVVAPSRSFALVWEVYDLTRGSDGRAHWRVRIDREYGASRAGEVRDALTGSLRAGTRVLAAEAGAPSVAYSRDAPATDVIADRITFNLGDVPQGRHVVRISIDDLVSGASTSRSVSVRVLDPRAQRGTR